MPKQQPSREDLLQEIDRLRQEAQDLQQEKADLEILLETMTEHSDTVEAELHNKAIEAVRESERKLAQFLEAMPVGIAALDPEGKPYYFNQRAKKLLGKAVTPNIAADRVAAVYRLYQAGTGQLYPSDRLPGVLALQGESINVDDIEVHQGEQTIPLEVWATPIFDEQGKVTDAISAFQDISRHKQAEAERLRFTRELEAKNAALEEMDRLKDEFLANTSHELRTPLNGIIGIAESLMDGATGALLPATLANLAMIASSGKRLATLVNNILDFARLKHRTIELNFKWVGVREVADVVLALSQPLLGRKPVKLINQVGTELPLVRVDEDRVQQILHNLVGNAIKFTHSGTVTVSAERVTENGIAIAVTDTGIGIPPEKLDRIFESFEQADGSTARKYGGTGLGLAITKQLVELHGGRIMVQSTVGVGSRFVFVLPGVEREWGTGNGEQGRQRAEGRGQEVEGGWKREDGRGRTEEGGRKREDGRGRTEEEYQGIDIFSDRVRVGDRLVDDREECRRSVLMGRSVTAERVESDGASQAAVRSSELRAESVQQPSVSPDASNSRFHILIVDDEPVNLQVLVNYLSLHNYSISQATSGLEALELLERDRTPDLILLDVMMPQMTGYEVCEKIRQKFTANQLPIILLTAKNQASDLTEGLNAGANDYLTKPVVKSELLARMKTHIQLAKINLAYERFVPHEFLDLLDKKSIVDVQVGDQVEREMTILFSDIRNFTTLSESMTPEDNFRFINAYLSRMAPSITAHQGFIDKYIGDAIMALYSGDADNAVTSAVAMLRELADYNKTRQSPRRPPIHAGIGINTGSLMLGTVGGAKRMDGTVISDAVNLAFRVGELTKVYGVSLLISHHTFLQLQEIDRYALRIIDRVKVKGKSDAVTVYEVFDADPPAVCELKLASRSEFERALLLYNQQNFSEAARLFHGCLQQNPADNPAQIYLKRCQQRSMD